MTMMCSTPRKRPWTNGNQGRERSGNDARRTRVAAHSRNGRASAPWSAVLLLAGAALIATAPQAQAEELVSNLGKTVEAQLSSFVPSSQAFTTGANVRGYLLSRVRIRNTRDLSTFDVSIFTVDGSGHPETQVVALSRPANFTADVDVFTAPPDTVLEPETTYAVRLSRSTGVNITSSGDEDAGAAPGWSIANTYRNPPTGGAIGGSVMMAIEGEPVVNDNAPLTATLELAGEDEGRGGLVEYLVDLRLNHHVLIPFADMRDHAFTVTGGTITRAKRHNWLRRYIDGKWRRVSKHWRLTVQSDETTGPTVLSLPDYRRCSVRGALCTLAGGDLVDGPEITLGAGENTAKVGLSVADTTGTEGGYLTYTVTASRPLKRNMFANVDILASEGTATAGTDYDDWGVGQVQLEKGDTTTSFRVFAKRDSVSDGGETVVSGLTGAWIIAGLNYNNGDYIKGRKVPITDAKGTGTISDAPSGSGVGDGRMSVEGNRAAFAGDGPPTVVRVAPGAAFAGAPGMGTLEQDQADDDPPTARLHSLPAEHGGAGQAFTVGLSFSDEVPNLSEAWVRDRLVTATNGTVTQAVRVESTPGNWHWTLTVVPASSANVVLGLTAGLDMPDGRALRVGASATLRGPAPSRSSVDGAALTLVWPEPRDGFGTPSGSDYAVTVNGVPRAVASAAVAGRRAVLVLSAPVSPADAVTVGYVGSAVHPLGDAAGKIRSAPWYGVTVANAAGTESVAAHSDATSPETAGRLGTAPPGVARLDASGLSLADLAGLGGFVALERLDLSDNALADLVGIEAHAGLRELDLSGNRIRDTGPLAALTALERLDLAGNRVTDVAPLAGLAALRVLVLDGNAVADLGPLTHLASLEHLALADNAVVDVTPLQDLTRLRRLDLGGNPVVDLSPLGDVGSLEWLALPGEREAAADALTRLTGLRWVWPEPEEAPAR